MYSVKIIDDFFDSPKEVRDYALSQRFYKRPGNYPGIRTDRISDINPSLFHHTINKVTSLYFNKDNLVEYDSICNFQLIDGGYVDGWIHQDDLGYFDVAGVIYLTPDAPIKCGTSIYKAISSVIECPKLPPVQFTSDDECFEQHTKEQSLFNSQFLKIADIGNVYNRAVIYPVTDWHTQSGFFGKNKEDSRLTMVFFIKFKLL